MSYYQTVERQVKVIGDLLNALNVLVWDSRVNMPSTASDARAQQIATLASLAQEKLLAPELVDSVEAAQQELGSHADLVQQRTLAAVRQAITYHQSIPKELYRALNYAKGTAQQAWVSARQHGDFSMFAPHLIQTLRLKRELASCIGSDMNSYDALMYEFEPSMTTTRVTRLFETLKSLLIPLAHRIRERPSPRTDFLYRTYDLDKQRSFALTIAETFGYDLNRGRLDTAPHPFEISFTRDDVRITTRYNTNYLPVSLFATWHETGHGLYEQGASPEFTRSATTSDLIGLYAVAGTSYSAHESQSRLWENLVARSRSFWEVHYGHLRDVFPAQLADVTLDEFYRAVNCVRSTPIRVEADEVTYHLHVMLRVELEIALLNESLSVEDLPEAWNHKVKEYLGLNITDDREGVLQDIHWSAGLFGAFPTYTIGTVMASQFFSAALHQNPHIEAQLIGGDYTLLHQWLTENIYRHARLYSSDELLEMTTGRPLDSQEFERYITKKYGDLYGL